MACPISVVGFSLPISASTSTTTLFFKEPTPRNLALHRPLRQLSYRTAIKRSSSYNTTDAILILNRISGQHRMTPWRHQREVVSCCMGVGSCTHMVFSGYWVGPDLDDGWGFVEAFVNRI